jgi:hypothetical protein
MESVHRILVDKEKVVINGISFMRLYFYDVMDGIVLMYDAPIFKSKGVPELDSKSIPEEPIPEEPVIEEPAPTSTDVVDIVSEEKEKEEEEEVLSL